MGRLNLNAGPKAPAKDAPASNTKNLKPEASISKTYLTKDDLEKFLSKSKMEVLNHPASNVWWIGSKEGGKTYPVIMDLVFSLETNPHAQGFVMKKYKTGAATAIHKSIVNASLDIKNKGFKIPDYESGQNLTYRSKQRSRSKNQTIEYGSFEDYNSVAGLEAKNGGFFSIVAIDEPVMMGDSDNIPSADEWDEQINGIKDTISRSSDSYMSRTGKPAPATKYHYMMNMWDDHPLIVRAEEFHPIAEFEEFVLADPINNHMMAVFVEELDTLIVRNTKFDNPRINAIERTLKDLGIENLEDFELNKGMIDWEAEVFKGLGIIENHFVNHIKKYKGTLLNAIDIAIKEKDSLKLAITLGFKYEKKDNNKVYPSMDDAKLVESAKVLKASEVASKLSIGIDIDYRRNIVITPGFSTNKQKGLSFVSNVVIGKQRHIYTTGTGNTGQKIGNYVKRAAEIINEMISEYSTGTKSVALTARCAVDDNSRGFIRDLKAALPNVSFSLAKKHDPWDIIKRQRWLNHAISTGWLMIDESNKKLIVNLKRSTASTGQEKRNESGKLEANYDEINSAEYMLWFLRNTIQFKITPGEISDYYEVVEPEKGENTNEEIK